MELKERLKALEAETANNSEMLKQILDNLGKRKPMIALDVEDASLIIGLKPQTIYQRTSAKFIQDNAHVPIIPHHKLGGKLVFYEQELIDFMRKN